MGENIYDLKELKEIEEWKKAYQQEKDEQFDLLQKYRALKQENEELKELNGELRSKLNKINAVIARFLEN